MIRWCWLSLLLSFSINTNGQSERALLWRISGNELAQPSYVYGTIHMICPDDLKIGDSLRQSVEMSNRLFLEIDLDAPGMMQKTMKLAMLESGTMKDLMNPLEYQRLTSFMKDSVGMPMFLLNKMKPMMIMSMIYPKLLPCGKSASYEEILMKLAKSQHKEVMGLESLEDQMAIFDQIPDTTETRMLMSLIDDFHGQKAAFANMVSAYLQKDLNKLGQMISESPDIDGFEDLLLAKRNRKWIAVMMKQMKQSSCVFAVGAGHLPGEDGVINLLRNEGFIVSPVE